MRKTGKMPDRTDRKGAMLHDTEEVAVESSSKKRPMKWRLAACSVGATLGLMGVVYGNLVLHRRSLDAPTNHPSRTRSPPRGTPSASRGRRGLPTDHPARLVFADRGAPASDRAGARDVELLAGDGVAGPRPARSRLRRAALRPAGARRERPVAALSRAAASGPISGP